MAQNDVTAHHVPVITAEDLNAFHAAHFATSHIETFAQNFLGPVEESQDTYEELHEEEYEEEDELGYYPDGVKRTLTDEQIAMFRHSEIQALLRKQRREEEDMEESPEQLPSMSTQDEYGEDAEGHVDVDQAASLPTTFKQSTEQVKSKRGKGKTGGKGKNKPGSFKQNIKPDLRKRTWDKVDTGMDSLDYGEESSSMAAPIPAPSRRKISYDDD